MQIRNRWHSLCACSPRTSRVGTSNVRKCGNKWNVALNSPTERSPRKSFTKRS